MSEKVVVGMSGGVDSSVAAYLLKKQGYDVIGVTMQIWQDENNEDKVLNSGCCGLSAVDDARRVAKSLDIPYYVMNFKEDFKKYVIDYFVDEYKHGRTPNPCIACNRFVKWESLLKRSIEIGASYIATGHYAKIKKLENERYVLIRSDSIKKDQTYALYNLTQDQLSKTLFPIGQYSKDVIREMAKDINLRVANKPDSQEICFVPDNNYGHFIEQYDGKIFEKGNFIDVKGNVLGTHKGIVHYTIGQRRGLGISLGKRTFVLEIKVDSNEVVLGENEDLFRKTVIANNLNFMPFDSLEGIMKCTGKIRYNHLDSPCEIEMIDKDTLKCTFASPQRAITPGQALVLYNGDMVIGGGTIIE